MSLFSLRGLSAFVAASAVIVAGGVATPSLASQSKSGDGSPVAAARHLDTKIGEMKVRKRPAEVGQDMKVVVRSSPGRADRPVSLVLRRNGKGVVVDTAKFNRKGRTVLTVPGDYVTETGYRFKVKSPGLQAVSFRSRAVDNSVSVPPPAPRNVTGEAGNAALYFSWGFLADALDYRVVVTDADGNDTVSSWTSDNFMAVPGLVNGATYSAVVEARNSDGTSASSTLTNLKPSSSAPGSIPSLAAMGNDESVKLTWSAAPRADNYVVWYRVADTKSMFVRVDSPVSVPNGAGSFSSTIEGLTNYQKYEFQVYGENDFGRGSADIVYATPVPGGDTPVGPVPAPVRALTTKPFDASIYVSWNAPTTGTPDNYLVYYSTDAAVWIEYEQNVGTDRNSTIKGLKNNQQYFVQVVATNENGPSEPMVDGPVTPVAKPSRLLSARGNPTDGGILLEWSPSAEATKYQIRYRTESSTSWAPPIYVDAPATGFFLQNLRDEVPYVVTVAAANGSGNGPAVSIGPLTPSNLVPSSPVNVQGVAEDGKVTLTWDAVPGATGYRVTKTAVVAGGAVDGSLPEQQFLDLTDGPQVTYSVPGLTNGQPYMFTVVATNQYGYSLPTTVGPFTPTA